MPALPVAGIADISGDAGDVGCVADRDVRQLPLPPPPLLLPVSDSGGDAYMVDVSGVRRRRELDDVDGGRCSGGDGTVSGN